jgi:hypothetical protein
MPASFWTIVPLALLLLASAWCVDDALAQGAAYEFRGSTRGRQGALDHIWKLQADGRITGLSTERRGGGLGGYSIDLSDTGRWQLRQNQLCIEWSGAFRPFSGCYGIERRQGNHVALNGPSVFDGQFDPLPPLR